MSEPGREHASAHGSQREMTETGVLENDIVVEELEQLALRSGFSRMHLVPLSLAQSCEIPAHGLGDFMRGRGLQAYWAHFCTGLADAHYIVLYKGDFVPTSRKPQSLQAAIELLDVQSPQCIRPGERLKLALRISNLGDTRWLCEMPFQPGWTGLGAHLYPQEPGPAVCYDWLMEALPRDVMPGEELSLQIELPSIAEPGDYRVVFDLLVEDISWFAEGGSPTRELHLTVSDN
jgi:hypothetical protein